MSLAARAPFASCGLLPSHWSEASTAALVQPPPPFAPCLAPSGKLGSLAVVQQLVNQAWLPLVHLKGQGDGGHVGGVALELQQGRGWVGRVGGANHGVHASGSQRAGACGRLEGPTWMGPGERHQSWMAQMARMEMYEVMAGPVISTSAFLITGLSLQRGGGRGGGDAPHHTSCGYRVQPSAA